MLSCLDVAKYFSVLVDRKSGHSVYFFDLHRLIHYAQEIHRMLYHNEHLFNYPNNILDLLEELGSPCTDDLYLPREIDFDLYSQQEKELMFKVYSLYMDVLRGLNIKGEKEVFRMIEFSSGFLVLSDEDRQAIITAEDKWWMQYNSGVPSEDVTQEILESKKELEAGKGIECKID